MLSYDYLKLLTIKYLTYFSICEIGQYEFKTVCAWPLRIKVIKDGLQVGYVCMHEGMFYVMVPDKYGTNIFNGYPNGYEILHAEEQHAFMIEAYYRIQAYYETN